MTIVEIEDISIEGLARAIHEDTAKAMRKTVKDTRPWGPVFHDFDDLSAEYRACRMEQARLMLERIKK